LSGAGEFSELTLAGVEVVVGFGGGHASGGERRLLLLGRSGSRSGIGSSNRRRRKSSGSTVGTGSGTGRNGGILFGRGSIWLLEAHQVLRRSSGRNTKSVAVIIQGSGNRVDSSGENRTCRRGSSGSGGGKSQILHQRNVRTSRSTVVVVGVAVSVHHSVWIVGISRGRSRSTMSLRSERATKIVVAEGLGAHQGRGRGRGHITLRLGSTNHACSLVSGVGVVHLADLLLTTRLA